jgi:glutaminase
MVELVRKYRQVREGELASYIPALLKANPEHCGICVVTTSGDTFMAGDTEVEFTIQSISNLIMYDLAMIQRGR